MRHVALQQSDTKFMAEVSLYETGMLDESGCDSFANMVIASVEYVL